MKLNTPDMEIALARHFNHRINLIVPNVYWGFGLNYEADLLVVSKSMYVTEVEIKVTAADIKNDLTKSPLAHRSPCVKRFFYAVPDYLSGNEFLPGDCGLIAVDKNLDCKTIRAPRTNKSAKPISEARYLNLLKLGCMRIWSLKQHIQNQKKHMSSKNEISIT